MSTARSSAKGSGKFANVRNVSPDMTPLRVRVADHKALIEEADGILFKLGNQKGSGYNATQRTPWVEHDGIYRRLELDPNFSGGQPATNMRELSQSPPRWEFLVKKLGGLTFRYGGVVRYGGGTAHLYEQGVSDSRLPVTDERMPIALDGAQFEEAKTALASLSAALSGMEQTPAPTASAE